MSMARPKCDAPLVKYSIIFIMCIPSVNFKHHETTLMHPDSLLRLFKEGPLEHNNEPNTMLS
jgi:hypothetical protein